MKRYWVYLSKMTDFTEDGILLRNAVYEAAMQMDRELLRALENAALLRNKLHKNSERVNIQPKCLICVDGIEESLSWSFWEERIEEAKAYEKDFAGIKFVFLARPYVFNEYYKLDYRDCFCRMPTHGDVSVAELFDNYIAYYNIELDGNNWITGMLWSY